MTKEEMFDQNIKLAYKIANDYLINYSKEYEDIKQLALIGLWRAVLLYNKTSKFSSFAGAVIRNEINKYLQQINKNRTISLEKEINEDGLTLKEIVVNFDNDIENSEKRMLLEQLIVKTKLTKQEKKVLSLLLEEKRQKEIGRKLKISHQRVSEVKRTAIRKIRGKVVV